MITLAVTAHGMGGGGPVTTNTVDTTGVNLLVAIVHTFGGPVGATLSDNKANSWSPLTEEYNSNGAGVRIYYCYPPANKVGSGHTFTSSASTQWPSVAVLGFTIPDPTGGTSEDESSAQCGASPCTTGAVTPGEAGALVVSAHTMYNWTGSPSPDNGLSVVAAVSAVYQGGVNIGHTTAWRTAPSTADINVVWTTGDYAQAGATAVFKTGDSGTPAYNPDKLRIRPAA